MKKIILISSIAFQVFTGTIYAIGDSLFTQNTPASILVNNRILAKVNDKAISVIDLMKKMDLKFYKQFPQYASSVEARYQFYNLSWKRFLEDVIDKELILADALDHDLKVSNGDVRQEMETLFGPNIILNLDKMDLTYEEAWKMVQEDLMIRRTLYFRANAIAQKKVTPQVVKNAYDEFAKDNINAEEWRYVVVTIRASDPTLCEITAKSIHHALTELSIPLSDLPDKMKDLGLDETAKITVSEECHHGKNDLSPAFREALSPLGANTYSQPIAQQSRNKDTVFRIFYLIEMIPEGATPFHEIDGKIKNDLLDKAIDVQTEAYLKKLRRHFNVQEIQELTSDDFQPFILK